MGTQKKTGGDHPFLAIFSTYLWLAGLVRGFYVALRGNAALESLIWRRRRKEEEEEDCVRMYVCICVLYEG